MKVLVINSGSSSLKYQLVDMTTEKVMCKGLCERIGILGGSVTHKAHGKEWTVKISLPTHAEAFNQMLELMTNGDSAVVADKSDINAIGHRVVHGGEKFTSSVKINEEVIETMEELSLLAPLHNPPQVQGIRSAQKVFGENIPQVAVFDTSFHQTMPPHAYVFAVPYEFYQDYSIRRYGFHGTSHRYVSRQAAKALGRPLEDLKIITCHLGNGSSITAVDRGKSIDTSMGLTPLGGIMMGTRSGDLDPSVATYMAEITGQTGNRMSDLLNTKSGFLGVSGISSDNRDIERAAEDGNERAQLVHDMLCYQIKKYIGAYTFAMGGLDCVVFTGGIGENSSIVREGSLSDLEFMGIRVDREINKKRGEYFDFSAEGATVRTMVIPTDEELMIARDTLEIVSAK